MRIGERNYRQGKKELFIYANAGRSICHHGGSGRERVNNYKIGSFYRIIIL